MEGGVGVEHPQRQEHAAPGAEALRQLLHPRALGDVRRVQGEADGEGREGDAGGEEGVEPGGVAGAAERAVAVEQVEDGQRHREHRRDLVGEERRRREEHRQQAEERPRGGGAGPGEGDVARAVGARRGEVAEDVRRHRQPGEGDEEGRRREGEQDEGRPAPAPEGPAHRRPDREGEAEPAREQHQPQREDVGRPRLDEGVPGGDHRPLERPAQGEQPLPGRRPDELAVVVVEEEVGAQRGREDGGDAGGQGERRRRGAGRRGQTTAAAHRPSAARGGAPGRSAWSPPRPSVSRTR